jgi:glycosyltransferase involved in cell wall biosynthesis
MNRPILTICIPTYNRADYLRDALESVRRQLTPALSPVVEVVVADNASIDHTETVAREYANKIDRFVYVKNPENIGFDGNVNVAVRAASGRYCWYLGDDDAIVNGALAHVVEVCREDKYAVISVADRPLLSRPVDDSSTAYSENDHVSGLSPTENYTRGHLPSALSMLIFRRDDWLREADFADHTPGWFYFEVILKIAVSADAQVLRIKKPMVLTGQDMRWADGGAGLKIFIDCNRFLRKMLVWGYDRTVITKELDDNLRRFPIVLMQAKSRDLPFDRKTFALIRDFLVATPLHRKALGYLVYLTPNALIKALRLIKKKLT